MRDNIKPAYIIDCNVIVKWFIPEKDSDHISQLLEKATNKEINLYSPAIILIEFANVLAKLHRKNLLSEKECIKIFVTLIEIIKENTIKIISLDTEQIEVLSLATKLNLSYYDTEYLYLSKKLKIELITFDKDLKKKT